MYVIKRKAINFSTCTFRKAQTFALVRTCVCMCVCFKSVRASKEHQLNYVQYVCVCVRENVGRIYPYKVLNVFFLSGASSRVFVFVVFLFSRHLQWKCSQTIPRKWFTCFAWGVCGSEDFMTIFSPCVCVCVEGC